MAKEFSAQDARNIITKHKSLILSLKSAASSDFQLKENIKKSVNDFTAQEVLNVLRGVPVDELNREKRGIRLKALIDNNFSTMADLYVASVQNIASVRGISEDTAYLIKKIVRQYVEKAYRETKIKLSTDDKNKYATALVKDISVYKNSLAYIQQSKNLLAEFENKVRFSIDELTPATSGLRWLFTFKNTKQKSVNAYFELQNLYNGEYGKQANTTLSTLKNLSRINSDEAWRDFSENNIAFYNILEKIKPGILGNDDVLYGLPEDLARQIQDECFFPDGLKCSLRRYQELGVKYILHQERVLLGDEMGLGKTVQAIATMVSLKNTGATHFVVVCPASVVTNWCREITKHSLLRATKVYGADRTSSLKAWLRTGGVAVTTYETTVHFKLDANFKFDLLVVDEAHYIKNPEAKRTINTKELCRHSDRLLFMTGTALENRVDEMISLIEILQPAIAREIKHIAFMSSAPQFRTKIAPVYYRRKREEVLTELPELIESQEWCTMTKAEESNYEDLLLGGHFMEARRVSWNVDDLENSSKANRLKEIVEAAESEDRKIIVFSFFLDTLRKISLFLGDKCSDMINGSINSQKRQSIIDEFDKSPAGSVLLAQIQSGGTGLNIQSASVVVICEPQLKPSIENQAISRAYRMGQSRNVLVYRLLCENSIDEKFFEMLEQKQAIFDAFADKSVAAQQSVEIDDKSFGDIIASEIERINAKRGIAPTQTPTSNANNNYYNSLLQQSYPQLVETLLAKYGEAQYDYFTNEDCKNKNSKVSRSKEGLFCHHIDEDKAILLSKSEYAVKYPFEYQKANRLVYCNLLEHLLLHTKIAESNCRNDSFVPFGICGALSLIVRQINDFYSGKISTQEYLTIATVLIRNDYANYITILNYLWQIIKNNPQYARIISREDLACDWDRNVITKILNDIKP